MDIEWFSAESIRMCTYHSVDTMFITELLLNFCAIQPGPGLASIMISHSCIIMSPEQSIWNHRGRERL